jgi:predicted nucleotide-binding protein
MREAVVRFLEKIDFKPIVLQEQRGVSLTIVEKLETYSDVGFAVVLLSPDDEGCIKDGTPQPRPRQNVILELGYFFGLLGRARVCALKSGDIEVPSDWSGVLIDGFDEAGGWRQTLANVLQVAGYTIDWNKVMTPP